MSNKCVLMVVDALAHRIVQQRFKAGKFPNLAMLVQCGGCLSPCTSIFPSITPAATCLIVHDETEAKRDRVVHPRIIDVVALVLHSLGVSDSGVIPSPATLKHRAGQQRN